MTHLVDIKYKLFLDSINGINIEISKRRNYINSAMSHVRKGNYYANMIKKSLEYDKELSKLKVIRNELWIIIMMKEINELI